MNPEPHEQRLEWKVGEDVHPDDPLPTDIENGMNAIHGCAPGDWSHRLYLMPIGTPLEDIIEFFEVGYPAALRHGWEEREVTDLIVETLNAINNIVPGSVEMAAPSGLRFRFWRCLRFLSWIYGRPRSGRGARSPRLILSHPGGSRSSRGA